MSLQRCQSSTIILHALTESAALVQAYILHDTFLAQNMRDSGIEKCRDQGLKKGTSASAAFW